MSVFSSVIDFLTLPLLCFRGRRRGLGVRGRHVPRRGSLGYVMMEDCTRFKSDPEPIEIALKRMDSKANNSVMVGDSLLDLGCAKNAAVPFVMVGWSVSVDPFSIKRPDVSDLIISEAKDLLEIL